MHEWNGRQQQHPERLNERAYGENEMKGAPSDLDEWHCPNGGIWWRETAGTEYTVYGLLSGYCLALSRCAGPYLNNNNNNNRNNDNSTMKPMVPTHTQWIFHRQFDPDYSRISFNLTLPSRIWIHQICGFLGDVSELCYLLLIYYYLLLFIYLLLCYVIMDFISFFRIHSG